MADDKMTLMVIAIVAIVAIIAAFGIVNATGMAVMKDRVLGVDFCSMKGSTCEAQCAMDFNCNMEKCRYIAKEMKDPVETKSCISRMTADHQFCLDRCNYDSPIDQLEASQ